MSLHSELRLSIPAKPDSPAKRDNEYRRCGTANVFGVVEPKAGRHFTRATINRSGPQFARLIDDLTRPYATARTIHVVMDNLNTHSLKSLTDSFGEEQGRRLWNQLTVHYTPNGNCRDVGHLVTACIYLQQLAQFMSHLLCHTQPKATHLFFQLSSRRYEPEHALDEQPRRWRVGQGIRRFHGGATAILDRLLHHSNFIAMRGASYRLKEKKLFGLYKLAGGGEKDMREGGVSFRVAKGPIRLTLDARPRLCEAHEPDRQREQPLLP